jgi:hydrogenase nickel incorporation protein HypA/HybF
VHELAIATQIVEMACAARPGSRVARVVVVVGRLAAVLPDALRFCFDVAAEGTPAQGAELEIVEVPGVAECRSCGAEVILDRPFGRCTCGSSELEWRSGEELEVREVEVVRATAAPGARDASEAVPWIR